MIRLLLIILFAAFFIPAASAQTVLINIGTTTVETSTLYTSTQIPWELKYGPGDSLWMTTRNGRVYRLHPTSGNATLLLDHSANVWQSGESGMLGMTFHPDFAANPYVYIAYTYTNAGNNRQRLSRFTYTANTLSAASEFVLIDNIIANTIHDGSRLVILADNTILMTTGDAANTANAQNTASLNGKILRVNLDGTIPADNPTAGSRNYTIGHRNPQGMVLHPNGKVYSTEHGPGNNDEFQIIEAGRNYGWPNVEGYCDNDIPNEIPFCVANNVMEPLASWLPAPGGTWAPNDLIWYTHPSIPEFENSLLVTFLKTNKIRSVRLNAAGDMITSQTDYFVNQWGRLRDITAAPNGTIYIATNTSPFRVIRVRNATSLPVNLTNYTAACRQNDYVVQWTTQGEINNKQFLLYRSNDAQNFTLIATVPSLAPGGNSGTPISYTYTDQVIPGNKIFYKLVSEDLDGRQREYEIVTATCGNIQVDFSLRPNPARGQSRLFISGATTALNIAMYTIHGRMVYQGKASSTVDLPVQNQPAGVYMVVVTNDRNEILFRRKLILQ